MTELGKVLKGLKCCKGLNGEQPVPFTSNRKCTECPYMEVPALLTGELPRYYCHHTNLMQDTIDILTGYVKANVRQEKRLKDQQNWFDSWSDCNYL